MDKAKRNRRMRERLDSLRDMPVTHEFKGHHLRPRFTMHWRGELRVSIQVEGRTTPAGVIERIDDGFAWRHDNPANLDEYARDELLTLGESVYADLSAKFERKQQREKGKF